jgi:predicted PurR-regulated permease PerM
MDNRVRAAAGLVIATVVILGLYYGRPLLEPLALAIIVWYLVTGLAHAISSVRIGGVRVPRFVGAVLSPIIIIFLLVLVVDRISASVEFFIGALPIYAENLEVLLAGLSADFDIEVMAEINRLFDSIPISQLVSRAAVELASLTGSVGLIVIYVAFLAFEQRFFMTKVNLMVRDDTRREEVARILARIQADIRTYVLVKTIMSVLTGFISFAVLRIAGVDFAALWGFIIFVLNYIPTIGSLLGVIFPAAMALVQFGAFVPFAIVTAILGATQFFIGNMLEPRVMGNSLNISPIVVMLSLALWGMLWGVTGMILCVPITVIAMIVFANFQSTRGIAIALSQDGRIEIEDPIEAPGAAGRTDRQAAE